MLKLRYYQRTALDKFFEYVAENHGKHPLIVMPTGSGKGPLQAAIIKRMLEYEDTRVLLITHQQELIKQNYIELEKIMDGEMDAGVYSAGLNCRDLRNRIIFAGIQSVYKKAFALGKFDLILVDECHMVNAESSGMYRSFFDAMEIINPRIVIAGLSATPYRMKSGLLTEGKSALFDDIAYEVGVKELIDPNHFKNTLKKQYLSNIVSKNSVVKVDLEKIKKTAGEYNLQEMEKRFNIDEKVKAAVREIIEYSHNRKKVLVFTAGIKHCENVHAEFMLNFKTARMVHSGRTPEENEKTIKNFKAGKFKYLINVNVLTTGFNVPDIDCIAMLRATMSPGLYCQIAGRGLRMAEGKKDCLFLDYGNNVLRHGPIDMITPRGTNGRKTGKAPVKECPECHSLLHLSLRKCPDCGFEYPEQRPNHEKSAVSAELISTYKKPVEYMVNRVKYSKHTKKGKVTSIRVDYYIGFFQIISEWVCIDHEGFAKRKAVEWIEKRTEKNIKSVDSFMSLCQFVKAPKKIVVDENKRWPEIINYEF